MTRRAPLLLILAFPFLAIAEDSAILIPSRFSVGDRVELRLEFDSGEPDSTVVVRDKDEFPDLEGIDIVGASRVTRKGKTLLTCVFVPWIPGETRMKAFSVNGWKFPERVIVVDPVLEKGRNDPLPPRPPVTLPGTAVMVAVAAIILSCLAAFTALTLVWFIPFWKRVKAFKASRRPERAFERALRGIAAMRGTAGRVGEYEALIRAVRAYASVVVSEDFQSLTSGEIASRSPGLWDGFPSAERLSGMFLRADLARFGREEISDVDWRADLEAAGAMLSGGEP